MSFYSGFLRELTKERTFLQGDMQTPYLLNIKNFCGRNARRWIQKKTTGKEIVLTQSRHYWGGWGAH